MNRPPRKPNVLDYGCRINYTDETEYTSFAPIWMWRLVGLAGLALPTHTAVGLVLAMLGSYSSALTITLGVPTTLILAVVLRRSIPARADNRDWSGLVAISIVLVLLIWTRQFVGQHVFTVRDPGSYLTTARSLSRFGELRYNIADPFLNQVPHARYTSPAVYLDGQNLEPQFSHGSSVVMAIGYDTFGERGIFYSSVVIGGVALLAFYLLLSSITKSRVVALAAMSALGISLPMLYVTRNSYSEPYVLFLLMLAIAIVCQHQARRSALIVTTLLISSTMMYRVDGQLYIVAWVVILGLIVSQHRDWRALASCTPALLIPWSIARIDLDHFAGFYGAALSANTKLLDWAVVAAAAICIATVLLARSNPSRRLFDFVRSKSALISVAVGAIFFALWFVRPALQTTRIDADDSLPVQALIEAVQQMNGLEPDGTRAYRELSLQSIGWYLGPFTLTLAAIGFALVTYEGLRSAKGWHPILLIFFAFGVPLYLWNPRITPDHLWATRRFLPFIAPSFLIAASVSIDVVVRNLGKCQTLIRLNMSAHRTSGIITLVGSAALLIPASAATWPVREHSDQRGWLGGLMHICNRVPEGSVLISLDTSTPVMPARAWCGARAAFITNDGREEAMHHILERASEECESVTLLASRADVFHPYQSSLGDVVEVQMESLTAEQTLTRRPSKYQSQSLSYSITSVSIPDHCSVAGSSTG